MTDFMTDQHQHLPEGTCEVEGCENEVRSKVRDMTELPEPPEEVWDYARFDVREEHYFCEEHARKGRTYRRDPEADREWIYIDGEGEPQEAPEGVDEMRYYG